MAKTLFLLVHKDQGRGLFYRKSILVLNPADIKDEDRPITLFPLGLTKTNYKQNTYTYLS